MEMENTINFILAQGNMIHDTTWTRKYVKRAFVEIISSNFITDLCPRNRLL